MSCSHCLNAVNRAVAGVPGVGVRSVTIGRADLTVPDDGTAALVKAAIEEAGYKVEGTA
ncbi:MAG: heavy-metal-associated domain-containing protein [Gemmatimonadales bacterium]|nr:heavy-metal-associated domain-containing protein [Gemmatimonadales bacterium]MBP9198756.1 heavy-metal-associated domain-containing protein [Gemmatimonadales bacterium]